MGAIAEQYADRVVVTDDNPRSEEPRAIINEILSGMLDPGLAMAIPGRAEGGDRRRDAGGPAGCDLGGR